jgi:LAGLIDADG-like domain
LKATPACGYSADTEILTRSRGWVTFNQLTYLDEVATRSPEGRFEWQHPEQISWAHYDGEMVWLHSRTLDLLVLPQHKILHMDRVRYMRGGVTRSYPSVEKVSVAADLRWQTSLVATSRWEPPSPEPEVTLIAARAQSYGGRLARPGNNFTASTADFAAYMGMYLAEGNLNHYGHGYAISIWQKTGGKGYREFDDLLTRIWGRALPRTAKGAWVTQNKALFTYLKACGGYAWTKRIPADILDLPAPCLEEFWRHYVLGDGTVMNSGGNRKPLDSVSTTSPEMAGQLQEVLQKLGGWGLLQRIDYSKYPSQLGVTRHLAYRLNRRAGTVACAMKFDRVPCKGKVGDVQVDGRPVYVRRNYRPVWAGG